MSNQPRKHHYVPRFHLSQWIGPDGKLPVWTWIDHLQTVSLTPSTPKCTGFEYDLYRLESAPPGQEQALESGPFSRLDNDASKLLSRLIKDGPSRLSAWERQRWAQYLASLMVRSPRQIEKNRDLGRRNSMEIVSGVATAARERGGHEEAKEIEAFFRDNPELLRDIGLEATVEAFQNSKRIVPDIVGFHWFVKDLERSTAPLILGDDPVVGTPDGPEAILLLPLTPKKLFGVSRSAELMTDVMAMPESEFARSVNYQSAIRASMRAYGVGERRFFERYLAQGEKAGPKRRDWTRRG